ncbi:MAG: phospho-N-acetylmuramoyl-pentapeptide-transferase [Deltaproteobacteria bacterium]|nr:MAG: phospho-N-acetylmuramoyl-pentapeptide-transferase [Deltaproteobacteria bacterium]
MHETYSFLNVIRYITFRSAMAMLTALFLSLLFGPKLIALLKGRQIEQSIREEGPQSHQKKAGTPTMGGTLILFALLASTLLWMRLNHLQTWAIILVTLGFGTIGFIDDYRKVILRNSVGLRPKEKLLYQGLVGIGFVLLLHFSHLADTGLYLPFFKDVRIDLGSLYLPFAFLVVVGASNAVNLTDGLDGLAIGPVMTASATFMILAYVAGHAHFADYLQIPKVSGSGELSVFCAAVLGAGLGFLWFNTYPAQVFMGDVGALALGGALGAIAVMTKNEVLLVIVGGIFVLETLSVIIQVLYFKFTGKRVFLMAPLHHHFELAGWPEPKIIVRFWIVSIILAILALSTLKLR